MCSATASFRSFRSLCSSPRLSTSWAAWSSSASASAPCSAIAGLARLHHGEQLGGWRRLRPAGASTPAAATRSSAAPRPARRLAVVTTVLRSASFSAAYRLAAALTSSSACCYLDAIACSRRCHLETEPPPGHATAFRAARFNTSTTEFKSPPPLSRGLDAFHSPLTRHSWRSRHTGVVIRRQHTSHIQLKRLQPPHFTVQTNRENDSRPRSPVPSSPCGQPPHFPPPPRLRLSSPPSPRPPRRALHLGQMG